MFSKPHFFLGLADAVASLTNLRMSLLMEAINFRVGTFLSSFCLPFSMRGVL